jgi:8-oxo-dGTP pyrophosphatase MutT (NUDIX family)
MRRARSPRTQASPDSQSAFSTRRDDLPPFLAKRLVARAQAARSERDVISAAVLVPLYEDLGEWWLLYTRRTDSVDVHRGQVSFPGGRIDAQDEGPVDAALREAEEEVGIPRGQVQILGTLEPLLTVTQFEITPVVGRIPWPCLLHLNTREVACAFGVPLAWLADPAHLHREQRLPPIPGREIAVFRFDPYLGETVWGATARITVDVISFWRGFAPK